MADDYDIHVSVETHYLDHRSSPNEDRFVFAYTITITNYGRVGAQLLRRHWIVKTVMNGYRRCAAMASLVNSRTSCLESLTSTPAEPCLKHRLVRWKEATR